MKRNLLIVLVLLLTFQLIGCEGCSRSGRKSMQNSREDNEVTKNSKGTGKTLVKMIEENGVYKIPIEINGSNMNFIFDTGASDITISATEAMFLYKQGTLQEEDILGTQKYQIADGSIAEGTLINLRTVKIGNNILKNVKASIVNNMDAPLLFGQSALAQFGKVTIDYNKSEITFE